MLASANLRELRGHRRRLISGGFTTREQTKQRRKKVPRRSLLLAADRQLFHSETNSENRAHLKIRFVGCVGRLRQCRHRDKPIASPVRDVWSDEKVPDCLCIAPFRENKFVQQLDSHRNSRRNFVARAERL